MMLEPNRWAWRPQEGPQQALVVRLRSFAVKLSWRPPGGLVGRISGLVMLCLAVGCWPRGFQGEDRQALAALILWVSQSSTDALRIKMHNKLAALVPRRPIREADMGRPILLCARSARYEGISWMLR